MDPPTTFLSDLRKRVQEIKKIDPKLQFSAQQLEERRRRRISIGLGIANLLPTSPLALAAPNADLASRNPGTPSFKLNTDFYRNSIVLRKDQKPQQINQPAPAVATGARKAIGDQQQEPIKILDKNHDGLPSDQGNLIGPNSKGIFMQLNPVFSDKTPQLPVVKPFVEQQTDKKPEKNLFESAVPVKQQLGLLANQNKTLIEPTAPSQLKEAQLQAAPRKDISSSLFGSNQPSLFGRSQSPVSANGQPSIFSSNVRTVQESGLSSIPSQKPLATQSGIFSQNNSLFKGSCSTVTQDKKQPHGSLFGISLFGKTSSGHVNQQKSTEGGLFQQSKKQPPKVLPYKEQNKNQIPPAKLPLSSSTKDTKPQEESIQPKQEAPKQTEQKQAANLKFSLFSSGLSTANKNEDHSFFTQKTKPPKNPFSLSQPQLRTEQAESNQQKKESTLPQVPEQKIEQEQEEAKEQPQESKPQQKNLFQAGSFSPQGEQSLSPLKKKPEMAIGPGGKGFELMDSSSFFAGDSKNKLTSTNLTFGNPPQSNIQEPKPSGLFGSQTPANASFGQSYFNKAATGGGLFGSESKPSIFGIGSTPNIFGESQTSNLSGHNIATQGPRLFGQGGNGQTGGLFSQGGSSQGSSIFGQGPSSQGGSLFGQGGSLFGQGGSLFGQGNKRSQLQEKEDEEDGQEDDSGPIEAVEEIDPTKSTGNYDYVQSNVIFKDTAVKFRQGSKQTLQNVAISVESFPGGKSTYLFVRLANKCIALSGLLMPGTTEIRILNNSSRNLQIKKILCQNKQPPELALIKIQLKDESIGSKLFEAVEKALKNE